MKKILFALAVLSLTGCALSDDSIACLDEHERVSAIHRMYGELLENDELTEEERTAIRERYETALEDPCAWSNQ